MGDWSSLLTMYIELLAKSNSPPARNVFFSHPSGLRYLIGGRD